MSNGISESALYLGLYLPGEETATTAALLKLERNSLQESGHLAYGLTYLENPKALALNPLHLPLQRETFSLPVRLLRDGGALPLSIKDALPDAWGKMIIAHELGGRIPGVREMLLLTNEDRIGAMVFSETRAMPPPAELPHHDLAQLAMRSVVCNTIWISRSHSGACCCGVAVWAGRAPKLRLPMTKPCGWRNFPLLAICSMYNCLRLAR